MPRPRIDAGDKVKDPKDFRLGRAFVIPGCGHAPQRK
jgi:hypothetical protein